MNKVLVLDVCYSVSSEPDKQDVNVTGGRLVVPLYQPTSQELKCLCTHRDVECVHLGVFVGSE